MATGLERLQAIKADLLTALANESAHQAERGAKPTYSLDGESYSWAEWREAVLRKIEVINRLIQQEQPFQHSSRGRA